MKALVVTSPQRHPLAPELPTMAESGFPGWDTGAWFGVMVRAGTPPVLVARPHAEAARALNAAEVVRDRLVSMGAAPVGNSPNEFGAFIRAESARWGEMIRKAGIKAGWAAGEARRALLQERARRRWEIQAPPRWPGALGGPGHDSSPGRRRALSRPLLQGGPTYRNCDIQRT